MQKYELDLKANSYLTNAIEEPRDCPVKIQFFHHLIVCKWDHPLKKLFCHSGIEGKAFMEGPRAKDLLNQEILSLL